MKSMLLFSTQNKRFVLRTKAWFSIVLMERLRIDDYWLRFESAEKRGMTHFHASDKKKKYNNIWMIYFIQIT
jgi:hypothetical protein